MSRLSDVDLVVEAVVEDVNVKRTIFHQRGELADRDAILATNTSDLDVDAIADAARRPAQVVGLHFLNPTHVMRLVETVPGRRTAPDIVAQAVASSGK